MKESLKDNSTFFERILQLCDLKDIKNINDLSKKLGYSSSAKLYRLKQDESIRPSFEIIEDFSKTFEDLNLRWLVSGVGEITTKNEHKIGHLVNENEPEPYKKRHNYSSNYNKKGTNSDKTGQKLHPTNADLLHPTLHPTSENDEIEYCLLCIEKERVIESQQITIDSLNAALLLYKKHFEGDIQKAEPKTKRKAG